MHSVFRGAFAALVAVGCTTSDGGSSAADSATRGAAPVQGAAPAPTEPDMRIEVDLAARQLHVVKGGSRVATHPVAVGSAEWPTKTGDWTIVQAVWNPEWVPPDESWAEERLPRKPGDPKNPLGHAQLVYDPPRSIHGTTDPTSIGKAVSHGSIRVTNEVAVQLAREVMEAAGVGKDEAWYTAARTNRTEKQIVDLPRPIPIRVF
jgi:lipoprotein-anchoring transpeptidase ErfK/SrfK